MQDKDGQLWVVADFGFKKLIGNLHSLEKATKGTISLDILEGCLMISVWCEDPEKITLGPVTQKIPGQGSSDLVAALEIACGRLLASLVTDRVSSKQRTMPEASET